MRRMKPEAIKINKETYRNHNCPFCRGKGGTVSPLQSSLSHKATFFKIEWCKCPEYDPNLYNFMELEYTEQQYKAIQELQEYKTIQMIKLAMDMEEK